MNLADFPHRRYNPLCGEWTLVSCHRTKRPWQGKPDTSPQQTVLPFDPKCALCPGNLRAGNQKNPNYDSPFTFDNDFPMLLPDIPLEKMNERDVLVANGEQGLCRVISYSPRHDLSLSLLTPQEIYTIIEAWENEYKEMFIPGETGYISIFENRGELMGGTTLHPHCQIVSSATVPTVPAIETINQEKYFSSHNACLLCTYVEVELKMKSRLILENDYCVAIVPFWAHWPYETIILPKKHYSDIITMSRDAKFAMADMLHRITVKLDNLNFSSFPYAMAVHQKPFAGSKISDAAWHFHIHFLPPLARNAVRRRFMTAYELAFMDKRDSTPEETARRLRACSERHYSLSV